jgi:integrase
MPLSDVQIRNAQPRDKPFKLADSAGLFLLVQPTGGKLWRLKYRIAGREKKLSLGRYPDVTLSEARKVRDHARQIVAEGRDPSLEKQRRKARSLISSEATFDAVAREYIAHKCKPSKDRWADATRIKNEWLHAQLGPSLGRMPVADIEALDALGALRKIEARGKLESARKAKSFASAVFRYAIATGRLASDPTRDLRDALLSPEVKHHAAILQPTELGALLRAIDGYTGNASTLMALRLAPHVFQRPGELRHAEWSEFDLEAAVWTIPAEKMKMRRAHTVPLSKQALAILSEARAISAPDDRYVFPSVRTPARPISENTLNAALRRLGYSKETATAHGFRSTASTLLNESAKWSPDAIERALAHGDKDQVRAAYNRGQHWSERVAMAQWWSDYLDTLRDGGKVLPFAGKGAAR